jgi:hypothetical protein
MESGLGVRVKEREMLLRVEAASASRTVRLGKRWSPPRRASRAHMLGYHEHGFLSFREAGAARPSSPTSGKKITDSIGTPHHDYHASPGTEWSARTLDTDAPKSEFHRETQSAPSQLLAQSCVVCFRGTDPVRKNAFLVGESDSVLGHSDQYQHS